MIIRQYQANRKKKSDKNSPCPQLSECPHPTYHQKLLKIKFSSSEIQLGKSSIFWKAPLRRLFFSLLPLCFNHTNFTFKAIHILPTSHIQLFYPYHSSSPTSLPPFYFYVLVPIFYYGTSFNKTSANLETLRLLLTKNSYSKFIKILRCCRILCCFCCYRQQFFWNSLLHGNSHIHACLVTA